MNDIEKAALRTYLWWKNRYYAIQNALPEDDLYQIVSGSPENGFCDMGNALGVDQTVLAQCGELDTPEIAIRRYLKDGDKINALALIRTTLYTYEQYLTNYLGQQFIDDNQGVFTWP